MRASRTLDSRTLGLVAALSLLALSQAAAADEMTDGATAKTKAAPHDITDVATAKTKAAASSKNILIDFSSPG